MSNRKFSCGQVALLILALAAIISLTSSTALAQEKTPRIDIFGGYSWATPGGDATIRVFQIQNSVGSIVNQTMHLPGIDHGWGAAGAYNFNKWFAVEADFAGHYSHTEDLFTAGVGPRLTYRTPHFSPFAHALFGVHRLAPVIVGTDNGFGAIAGGGFDMWFGNHVAWRVFQADYLYGSHQVSHVGGDGTFHGVKVQGGLVVGLFTPKETVALPTASCSLQPTAVLAGEPITANVSVQNFNPKHTVTYAWKTTGGQLSGKETTASIDTAGMAPGSYTVTATANDTKAKKGYETATCNASFTINEPPKHPPTISCSVSPTTLETGNPATITCQANSPDNRPLTYDWRANGGSLTPNGLTATLDTKGAPAGPITITTTTSDDRGLTASATTTVNVEVPPPPPQASKIGDVTFPNTKKPGRVDNTAKAVLDDVSLRVQRESDAKVVVVGYFDPAEKGGIKLAQERAVNTKDYLVAEKGIDPSRIELRTAEGGNRAEIYMVPPGATFNVAGSQVFDESAVKKPVKKSPAHKKAPAAKKAAAKS